MKRERSISTSTHCGRTVKDISILERRSLVNPEQLQKNRYYISSLIDVVGFSGAETLLLQGKVEGISNMSEGVDFSSHYWTIRLKRTLNSQML